VLVEVFDDFAGAMGLVTNYGIATPDDYSGWQNIFPSRSEH